MAFGKILVGYDESEGSRDALALAQGMAARSGGQLVVVTVVPTPVGGSFAPSLPADAYANLREQAAVAAANAASEVDGTAEIVEATSPARGLEEAVEELGADLVVVGCPKASDGRVKAGRKARHLMQGGRAAVLLAPAGIAGDAASLERVAVAVNGTPESDYAVDVASELASGGSLRVISVATDFADYWGHWGATFALSELEEASREVARKVLDEATSRVPEGIAVDGRLLEGEAGIELAAESGRDLDLICVGSRSYGPLLRVLLGSVSSELVADAGCPVLVLPRPS